MYQGEQAQQAQQAQVRITELLDRINHGLGVVDNILDDKDGEVRKEPGQIAVHQMMAVDDSVDAIRKWMEEIAVHVEALHPRLRKIARAL